MKEYSFSEVARMVGQELPVGFTLRVLSNTWNGHSTDEVDYPILEVVRRNILYESVILKYVATDSNGKEVVMKDTFSCESFGEKRKSLVVFSQETEKESRGRCA